MIPDAHQIDTRSCAQCRRELLVTQKRFCSRRCLRIYESEGGWRSERERLASAKEAAERDAAALRAVLTRVKALPEQWRKEEADEARLSRGWTDGKRSRCANALDAALASVSLPAEAPKEGQ